MLQPDRSLTYKTILILILVAIASLTIIIHSLPSAWGKGYSTHASSDHQERDIELVFVDSAIPNFSTLMDAIASPSLQASQATQPIESVDADRLVFRIDRTQGQGIATITQTLTHYTQVKAIHLISHGSSGSLQVGIDVIDHNHLAQYQADFSNWQTALSPTADLLIYGCNVAQGKPGIDFLNQLHQLTHADVQASTDLTGDAAESGNWILEFSIGQIETHLAFSAERLSDYVGVLKQLHVTTLVDQGNGSLRWAIEQANASPEADLIDLLHVSGVIALQDSLPNITGDLHIIGDGNDTINGNHTHRVLLVESGDVVIHNLTIANGLAQGTEGTQGRGGGAGMGGGLLIDSGTVTLTQVRFIHNQAIAGRSTPIESLSSIPSHRPTQIQIRHSKLDVNRGAIASINGISQDDGLSLYPDSSDSIKPMANGRITSDSNTFRANRGAIAGVNGIGINGIGSIVFGGGGGFGGFGNAGNGGNGGNAGVDGGNGGNGGDGGDGGVGIFGDFGQWRGQGAIGTVAFGGGGGFGGFGNAGNGGNGGNATRDVANGGDGGNGGNGGFGGGGGAGGKGGNGGELDIVGEAGIPGKGGFGGGDGSWEAGGGGGGFGGAIFIRSGQLILHQTSFEHNQAIASPGLNPGLGKGGAIFMVTDAIAAEAKADPAPTVIVLGESPRFIDNQASDAGDLPTDNSHWYGTFGIAE